MIIRILGRGLLTAAVVSTAALGVATAPAQAAPADLTVSATRLVLEPGERGYTGTYHVTITNAGDEATSAGVRILEPIAASFRQLRPGGGGCLTRFTESGRTANDCVVPGGAVQPGEVRRFRVDFGVLTTPQAFAMSASDTATQLVSADLEVLATATSRTLFRSTTGELTRPRPYVQDDHTDLTVSAGDVRLTEQADGSFLGTVPLTVRSNGDAPHWDLILNTVVPEGFRVLGAGNDAMCGGGECVIPGGAFLPGESRTLEVEVSAPAGTPLGDAGTGTAEGRESWFTDLPEADPSDNTATFRLTVG
ncbi:hypothetical protein [Paractinoplanes brasiliensis]|uniref:hypothetical protein n=1 Tax=Paractinoplanes brasiliensis TaxID=52695 RepID=UPI00105DCEEB|nr:hypothetical protein [Actinoplanes brasiliensis]GID31806.1 hypothetical protein Abr02nite_67890 [Actinoplanes brasiliensis]